MAQQALKPSPELDAFATKLVENIREVSRQENHRLAHELSIMFDQKLAMQEERINVRIASLRAEMREDMNEIKTELHQQSATLGVHSTKIASIEQRLANGDQWMKAHEGKIEKVEDQETESRISLAFIAAKIGMTAAGAGLGGGIALFVSEMLHRGGH